jgi:hypothetical protein
MMQQAIWKIPGVVQRTKKKVVVIEGELYLLTSREVFNGHYAI